jgi:aspartate/tyrosine/aromatic aminotransferase
MNVQAFLNRANQTKAEFERLRDEMVVYAGTAEGRARINAVDNTAVRKLRMFKSDITPARLVSLATKLCALP